MKNLDNSFALKVIEQFGRAVTAVVDGVSFTFKAYLQPIRPKSRVFSPADFSGIGELTSDHTVYIGSPCDGGEKVCDDALLYVPDNDGGKKYIFKCVTPIFIGSNLIYVHALLQRVYEEADHV